MKTILTSIAAAGLVATLATAQPQPRYTVKDLGTLPGGTFSAASQGNTDNGLVGGVATVSGGAQHAVVWYKGRIVDIATSGLGGPNSITIGLNARGQAVGAAETSTADSENFCAFGSGFQCLPFVWQNGVMTALPMLGGKTARSARSTIEVKRPVLRRIALTTQAASRRKFSILRL